MAEAHQHQTGRSSSRRGVSSITCLENNVAELIAQDMRQLELEDARSSMASGSSRHETASRSRTTDRALQETAGATIARATTTETHRTLPTYTSNRADMASHTSDTTRSWTDRLHRSDPEYESSTRSSWRDSREQTAQDTRYDRVASNTETGGHEYVAGSYRRGSWRERLGLTEASATLTPAQEPASHGSSTQEYVPGSYRRGSWRDKLNRQLSADTADTAPTSRHRSSISDSTQEYVPGSYRRGSWRERLGREDSSTTVSTRPWRERLSRSETMYDAPAEPSQENSGVEDSTASHHMGVFRPGSWRERVRREETEGTSLRSDLLQEIQSSQANTPATGNREPIVFEAQAYVADNVAHVQDEVANRNDDEQENDNVDEDLARTNSENTEAEKSDNKASEKSWTVEEVLKLLVKAINYRSPLRDLETILKWQFDVNIPHKNGLRALHYAAYTNYVNCVELLLNHGANINITDDIGYTPLHLAARCGHYKTIDKLIENGAMITFNEPGVEIRSMDSKNKLGFTSAEPINLAIQNQHPECAELLLKHGARPDNKYFMGYEISLAPLDDIRCIEVLLRHGASPNVFNRCGVSPLMKACKDHRIDVVRLLLQHGADYNAQCPPLFEQKSVLQVAIDSGNIVIVNLILFKNPKLSRNENYGYSALHTAIMKGRSDICRLLLQKGADPEERTEAGATPLMLACSYVGVRERREVVQMLLDCGADVNAFGENFSYVDPYLTPMAEYLKTIGSSESFSIVELLISSGARIHFTSGDVLLGGRRDPYSILQFAHVLSGNPAVFELVLQASQRFSPLAIHACESLPDEMKNVLLGVATQPVSLKQTVRLALRNMLMPDTFDNVMELPLPPLIQNYLLLGLLPATSDPNTPDNPEAT